MRALALCLLLAFPAAAAAANDEPPAGLIGLLAPAVVPGGPPGCVRVDLRERLPLHAGPDRAAPRIGWLSFRPWRDAPESCDEASPVFEPRTRVGGEPVPRFESDYEVLALAVTAQSGEWHQLHLGEGRGWLRRPAGYRFEAYPGLLAEKLAHATPAWDGRLCAAPGTDCRDIAPAQAQPLRMRGHATHAGAAWIEVELTTEPCRDGEATATARGWMRAHAADGRPTAWFHPRGC